MYRTLIILGLVMLGHANGVAAEQKASDDPVTKELKSASMETRLSAIAKIEALESIPEAYIPFLLQEAIRPIDKSAERTVALSFLLKNKSRALIGKAGKSALPALREFMKNDDARWEAVAILQRLGENALPALPELIDALKDKNKHVRYFAAKTIMQLGPKASLAVPELTKLIVDPHDSAREFAIRALGAIGTESKPALPSLTKAANEADFMTRKEASEAIAKINAAAQASKAK